MPASSEECAHELLEVVPLVMRRIRAELRTHREGDLSVPQYRAMAFLRGHKGTSLSELAEHIGLGLPSMSKLVDGLVARGLVVRQEDPGDRRRLFLCLTEQGQATVAASRAATQADLAKVLGALAPAERATVTEAMHLLRPLFTPDC